MVRATGGVRDRRAVGKDRHEGVRWPRWAAASAGGVLLGLVVLSVLFRGPGPGSARRGPSAGLGLEAGGPKAQDIVSVTWVSRETGLQIVWFFDKNFHFQGDHE